MRGAPQILRWVLSVFLCGPFARAMDDTEREVGSPRIDVIATHDHLQLGTDAPTTIEVRGPGDMADVTVTTNAGQVVDVARVSPGRFTARYLPPSNSLPQVAIVAAVARCGERAAHGWLALPLWGTGSAVLRTRRGASVAVDIAGVRFGPVRAGRDGVASVPVNVPPGVHQGHDGRKPVDLHLPATPRAHVVILRGEARADQGETIPLRVYAVTEDGRPLEGTPEITAGRGALTPLRRVAPGAWAAELLLDPGRAGPVDVRVAAEPGSPASTTSLDVVAGSATSVTLALPDGPVAAGADVELRVTTVDRLGNPTDAPVELSANLGTLSPPGPDGSGAWVARCRVPAHFGAHDRLRIRARVRGTNGEIHAETSRPLAPGAPAAVALRAPRRAQADGHTSVAIGVDVRDRHGNRVAEAAPKAFASRGSVDGVERRGRGFVVHWTPPVSEHPATGDVAVRVGSAERCARIDLYPRPHRLTLGAKAGYLHGVGNLSLPSLALEGGLGVSVRGYPLWLLAEAGLQRAREADTVEAGPLSGQDVRAETDVFSLVFSGGWRPLLGRRFLASLTAGAGLLVVNNRVQLAEQPAATDHQVVPAVQGAAGLGWRLGPGHLLVEGRYRWATSADRPTVEGPLSAAGASLGYVVEIL